MRSKGGDMPVCPVCTAECNEFFVAYSGREIVGCENCIFTENAWERTEADDFDERMQKGWDEYGERG